MFDNVQCFMELIVKFIVNFANKHAPIEDFYR